MMATSINYNLLLFVAEFYQFLEKFSRCHLEFRYKHFEEVP